MVDDVLTVGNDSNNKITVQPGSMQIGSTANGITFDSNGDATFNGEITISSGLASSISGSSNALSGSVSGEIGALQEGSSSMATQVVLSSGGMDLKNAAADTTLASYGATTTIGVTSTEHVEITSTSLKLKDDTTELVSISGTTVVVGSDTNNRVTITPTSMQICLLYTSPSPRDRTRSRMPSSA